MNGTADDPCPVPCRRPTRPAPAARRRLAAAGLLAAALWAGGAWAQDASPGNGMGGFGPDSFGALVLEQPFPFEARDVAVTEVIRQMALRAHVPMIAAEGLGGRVDVANADGSVRDVLESLAEQGHLVWWFDGAAVQVEPPGSVVSRLIPLRGVALADLRRHMQSVRLDDSAWPLVAADGEARVVRVVGPRGYADAIDQIIAALAAEIGPAESPRLPVVIRGPGRRRAAAGMAGPTAPLPAAPHVPAGPEPLSAASAPLPPGAAMPAPVIRKDLP